MKTKHLLLIAFICVCSLFACKKKEKKYSPIEFYLMDSPANYDSVKIHVKNIDAKIVGDSTVWFPIHTKDTIVNLLSFQDSVTLMMASDIVPTGRLEAIRFTLGDDNTVVVNGVSHPLELPDATSPTLLINIERKLNEAFNGFILDFDASQSIIQSNDSFKLSPVVKLIQ